MRRIFITVCTFVACLFTAMAQMSYTFNFNESDYYIENNSGIITITPKRECVYKENAVTNGIPYIPYNLLIPRGATITDIEVRGEKKLIANNIILKANPKSDMESNIFNDSHIMPRNEANVTSTNHVEMTGIHILKGYYFASLLISPFSYDATSKQLYFMQNISLLVQYQQSKEYLPIVKPFNETDINELVINPEEWELWYNPSDSTISQNSSERIDYIIISPDDLKDAFVPLVKWKNMKGVRTKVVTLGEIYDQYNDERYPKLRIKKYLKDCYDNKGLKFAMLVGDNSNFPSSECDVIYQFRQRYNTPVDLFYSCFDKDLDWSLNNDTVTVGLVADSVDFYPEIYLSRLPIKTKTQAENYINKLLRYELNPQRSSYLKKLLLVACNVKKGYPIDIGQQQSDTLLYKYIIPTGWNGYVSYLYESKSSFCNDGTYDVTPENIQYQLNQGYHFVNTCTHGFTQKWTSLEDGRDYDYTFARQLNNNNSSIILTTACFTNAFDSIIGPSLSETLLDNPHGGAIAYLGSLREGTFETERNPSKIGISMRYNAEFFTKLFDGGRQSKSFAEVVTRSRYALMKFCNFSESSHYNWVQLLLNPVGESEFQIWTEDPVDFNNIKIEKTGNTLRVYTGGITDCKVVVTNFDLPSPYFQINESDSICEFTNIPDTVNVVVSKQNYVPAVYKISDDTLHIINNVITNNCSYRWNNIVLGSDDPEIDHCECIIANGANVIFEYENSINFNTGFKCELGSSFEVRQVE